MNNVLIKKDDFIEIIEDVRKVNKYHEDKNNFFSENGVDGYIFEPECCDTVVRLLHLIFGEYDSEDEIAQFCFAGNFGKRKKECVFKDDSGEEHEIKTAGELYDYLLGV